ncbi:gamma-glutamyl-gamma-aminobutyrate hydrolase family protein [Bacillota bacterium]
MKKMFSKPGAVLLSLLLSAFVLFGCGGEAVDSPAELPDIGISWCDDIDVEEYGEDLQAYIDAVEKAGGNPVLLPLIETEEAAESLLDSIDALVLTGGEDVDPSYYGEDPDPNLEDVNVERDTSDFLLLQAALDRDLPVLAICRGFQVLNVISGGSLYQDIPTLYGTEVLHRSVDQVDFAYHDIDISEGSLLADIMGAGTLNVNSWHHQGVKNLGEGLDVIANSEDGMVEAVQKEGSTFVLGLQFHPEWHVDYGETEHLKIFEKLVELASE